MKKEHIHKYMRLFLDKDISKSKPKKDRETIYRCTLPDCNHYLRKMFVLGRKNLCWKCGAVHIIGPREIGMKKPTCGCNTKRRKMEEKFEESNSSISDLTDILKLI